MSKHDGAEEKEIAEAARRQQVRCHQSQLRWSIEKRGWLRGCERAFEPHIERPARLGVARAPERLERGLQVGIFHRNHSLLGIEQQPEILIAAGLTLPLEKRRLERAAMNPRQQRRKLDGCAIDCHASTLSRLAELL